MKRLNKNHNQAATAQRRVLAFSTPEQKMPLQKNDITQLKRQELVNNSLQVRQHRAAQELSINHFHKYGIIQNKANDSVQRFGEGTPQEIAAGEAFEAKLEEYSRLSTHIRFDRQIQLDRARGTKEQGNIENKLLEHINVVKAGVLEAISSILSNGLPSKKKAGEEAGEYSVEKLELALKERLLQGKQALKKVENDQHPFSKTQSGMSIKHNLPRPSNRIPVMKDEDGNSHIVIEQRTAKHRFNKE